MAVGATTRDSYANAVRGRKICTMGNLVGEKLIRIVISFARVDRGWCNVNNKLILARRWVERSAHVDVICKVNWEDVEARMDVVVSELVAVDFESEIA